MKVRETITVGRQKQELEGCIGVFVFTLWEVATPAVVVW